MKKFLILFCLTLLSAVSAWAETADVSAVYIYSSDYNQARAGASVALGTDFNVGIEGRWVEDKISAEEGGLKDPVYSVYLPVKLELEMLRLSLTPFYYFKNKSDNALYQDASAYGAQAQLLMNLRSDDLEERYTRAFINVAYARQKGTLFDQDGTSNQNYTQMAYTLGLWQNFYNAFSFQASGTAYQYPDGITGVEGFRGVLNQNDLGFVQSYDVNRSLGKYTLAARITRMWPENRSTLYLGYHYAEFYTADPQHSFLLGNSFYVLPQARIDAAYNHLQNTDGKNKRDVFYVNLHVAF